MIKQVLIIRKDLHMRQGKAIVQGAHAALGAAWEIADNTNWHTEWVNTGTTKICVYVESLVALQTLYDAAIKNALPCYLVTDAGRTEFKEPTITCLAIGPAPADQIDILTKALPLL